MSNEDTAKKIETAQSLSQLRWEQAADEPRDETTAKEFIEAWDECIAAYDAARASLKGDGWREAARVHLEAAQRIEAEYGDDDYARSALAALPEAQS